MAPAPKVSSLNWSISSSSSTSPSSSSSSVQSSSRDWGGRTVKHNRTDEDQTQMFLWAPSLCWRLSAVPDILLSARWNLLTVTAALRSDCRAAAAQTRASAAERSQTPPSGAAPSLGSRGMTQTGCIWRTPAGLNVSVPSRVLWVELEVQRITKVTIRIIFRSVKWEKKVNWSLRLIVSKLQNTFNKTYKYLKA